MGFLVTFAYYLHVVFVWVFVLVFSYSMCFGIACLRLLCVYFVDFGFR